MKLKQQIKEGEKLLDIYIRRINQIDDGLVDDKDAPNFRAIGFLLNCEKERLLERAKEIEKRLVGLRRQWEQEMDVQAAEANMHMDKIIMDATSFIGHEPVGVTSLLQPLIVEFIDMHDGKRVDQERKNEIYMALKGHVNFLTKKLKR